MKKSILTAAAVVASLVAVGATVSACTNASGKLPQVVVYKNPTCGCCEQWIGHMRDAGFRVTISDTPNVEPLKRKHNVPENARSCHTALVDGYVVEGHVPVEDVLRMLDERPDIDGIATPGMPMGSPGMEGPTKDPYNVVAFAEGQTQYVYSSH